MIKHKTRSKQKEIKSELNQSKLQLEATTYIHHNNEKIQTMNRDSQSRISIHRSDLPSPKILLY
ncbi:MAG: hypothetical protein WA995_06705 [Priestia megaterium]